MTNLQMANATIELVRYEVKHKWNSFTDAKVDLASALIRKDDHNMTIERHNDFGRWGHDYDEAVRQATEQVKVKESELQEAEGWLTYTINKFLEGGV